MITKGKRRAQIGKARFYADENVDRALVDHLRDQGFKVEFATELGLAPRDDSFHLQEARRRKCILLTNDVDFLNNRKFPFRNLKDTAIVILRTHSKMASLANFGYAMLCLLEGICPSGNRNLYGLKIEIKGPRMIFHARVHGQLRRDEVDISKPVEDRDLFQET